MMYYHESDESSGTPPDQGGGTGFNLGSFFDAAASTATSYPSQLPAPSTSYSYQDYNAPGYNYQDAPPDYFQNQNQSQPQDYSGGFNWQQPLYNPQNNQPDYSGGTGSSDWGSSGNGGGSNWFQNLNLPNLFENSTPAPDQGFNFPNFGQQNNYGFPSSNTWAQPGQIQKQQADQLFAAPGEAVDAAASSNGFLSGPGQTVQNVWRNTVDPLLGFTPSIAGDISQGQFPSVLAGAARTLFDGTNYGQEMQTKKQQATGEMYDAFYKASGGNIDQANQAAQHLEAYLNPANLAEYNGLEDFHKLPGPIQAAVTMGDPVLMGGMAYLSKLKGVRPVPGEAPQMLHSEAPTIPELEGASPQLTPQTGQGAGQLPALDYYADRPGFVQNLQKAIFDTGGRPTAVSDLEKNRVSLIKGGLSQDEYMNRLAQAAAKDGLSLDEVWKAAGQTPPAPAGTVAPSTVPQVNLEPSQPYSATTARQLPEKIIAESVPTPENVTPQPTPLEPLPLKPRPGREAEPPPRPIAAEAEPIEESESATASTGPDWWQKPSFYLPAGAAAFGGGYGIGALQDTLRQTPQNHPQFTTTSPALYPGPTNAASLPPPTNAVTPTKPAPVMSNAAFEKKYQAYQTAGGEHADHMETAKTEFIAESAPVPPGLTGANYQKTIKSRDNFLKANPTFAKALTQRRTTQPLEPLDYQGWDSLFKTPVTYFEPSENIESIRDRLRKPGNSGYSFQLPAPVMRPVIAPGPALPAPLMPLQLAIAKARKSVLL